VKGVSGVNGGRGGRGVRAWDELYREIGEGERQGGRLDSFFTQVVELTEDTSRKLASSCDTASTKKRR
jgi:hypothetical protein